jgi:hypothetical protein
MFLHSLANGSFSYCSLKIESSLGRFLINMYPASQEDPACLTMHKQNIRDQYKVIKFIYIALRTSADISKCCTETQPKTPNSKQCRCKGTVARKNSLERPKPRKKPGYVGWPVLFWLCRVEIITKRGQDVQMFINDQHG